jgi:hypothetical protein
MKFVTSSKNDALRAFGAFVAVEGTVMSRVFAPSWTRTMSTPAWSSAAVSAASFVEKT